MSTLPEPERLRRSYGTDRVAVVSVEPATAGGTFMIRIARGPDGSHLGAGTAYGPYPEAEVAAAFALARSNLVKEGFAPVVAGWELVDRLQADDRTVRARAAVRLGWRAGTDGLAKLDPVPPLLAAAQAALDEKRGEVCPLVEALGRIGDPRAVPLARTLASAKSLSRRRSGVEALHLLLDAEGIAAAREASLDRLPPSVRDALGPLDEGKAARTALTALLDSVKALDARRHGLVADTLYAANTPLTVAAARRLAAGLEVGRPHAWRYQKSLLKRAFLRRDARTIGLLAHAIDRAGSRTGGEIATVKSGRDGKKRSMRIFGRKTSTYVRRACWRYLRDLARWAPAAYPEVAAEILVRYTPADALPPKGRVGAYGRCYLLMRILHGRSPRLKLLRSGLRFGFVSSEAAAAPAGLWTTEREEPHSDLWDAAPGALVRVVTGARLPSVFRFGCAGLTRDPQRLPSLAADALVDLLSVREDLAPESARSLVDAAWDALAPRYRPARFDETDRSLLDRLVRSAAAAKPAMRERIAEWLMAGGTPWARHPELALRLLDAPDGAMRQRVVTALAEALDADRALADRYADDVSTWLADRAGEDHVGLAILAERSLVRILAERVPLAALLVALDAGSLSARRVVGAVLGMRGDALAALGPARVLTMADDEAAAVRAGAHAILRGSLAELQRDPSALYQVAESPWADSREVAMGLLREIDLAAFGIDALIGLCDSTEPALVDFGRERVQAHFAELDTEEVLFRLSEHPDRAMRSFALTLMREHLRPGLVPLARLEGYFRAVLYDPWPTRALKWGSLAFLLERGLSDERQAELVTGWLSGLLNTETRLDFERVLEGITRIMVAHPAVETPVRRTG